MPLHNYGIFDDSITKSAFSNVFREQRARQRYSVEVANAGNYLNIRPSTLETLNKSGQSSILNRRNRKTNVSLCFRSTVNVLLKNCVFSEPNNFAGSRKIGFNALRNIDELPTSSAMFSLFMGTNQRQLYSRDPAEWHQGFNFD